MISNGLRGIYRRDWNIWLAIFFFFGIFRGIFLDPITWSFMIPLSALLLLII